MKKLLESWSSKPPQIKEDSIFSLLPSSTSISIVTDSKNQPLFRYPSFSQTPTKTTPTWTDVSNRLVTMDMKLRRLEGQFAPFSLGLLSNPSLVVPSVFPPTSLVSADVASLGMSPTAMTTAMTSSHAEILASLRRRIEALPSDLESSSSMYSQLLTDDGEYKLKSNLEQLKNELNWREEDNNIVVPPITPRSPSTPRTPVISSSACASSLISFYSFSSYAGVLPAIAQRLKEVENLESQVDKLKELVVNIHEFIVSDGRGSTSPPSTSLVHQLEKTAENCTVVQKNLSSFSTNISKELTELEELMAELRKLKKK